MNNQKIAAYGSWKSPITSDLIVAGSIGLGEILVDQQNIYWLESRPNEGGRTVLVKQNLDQTIIDITPSPYNIRTRVHEYGGAACLIVDDTVYFSNFLDQRIYQQTLGQNPQPLTPESALRYANAILDINYRRLICVGEDHSQKNSEPVNSLLSIDLETGEVRTLISGADFYSSPVLNPNGNKLAWLTWNHPNLPWDESQLWLAEIQEDGNLGTPQLIAGGKNESICEPKWSPAGELYFSSDSSGWWNLYRYNNQSVIEALLPMEAEFAYPHWVFGISTYTFIDENRLICTYTQDGRWYLGSLDLQSQQFQPIDTPYTNISSLQAVDNNLIFLGASFTESTAVIKLDLTTNQTTIIKKSSDLPIEVGYLSIPEAITFPTENGLTAHAWYYSPKNPDYQAEARELPPLLVKSHGGPTAAANPSLSLRVQYWTSRGFAYLDVNYGGSSGFGREYRQRLVKNWGIVDVADCVNAAKYLVKQRKVDSKRLAISGGSAGGYTTLAALTFYDLFTAGASYYGICDLEALAKDTHKFESRYLDSLIGKYPQEKAIYQQRSPIHYTDNLSGSVIFFQGLEDKVVPPNQAEMMVAALQKKGLPVAYVAFEGEQHGFRRAENIKRALDGEFYFYSQVFGFVMADSVPPVPLL
jgi:dipeptidyl aminopeptidase/acylaminoacyl peptidase